MSGPRLGTAVCAALLGATSLAAIAAGPWQDLSSQLPQAALADRSMDVLAGDADGDGDLDLFVAKEFAPNLLLRNQGDARFVADPGALPQRGEDSEDVVLGDFDADGGLDVVFVSEDTPLTEYYRNDGSGRYSDSPCPLPANLRSNAGVAGDLDGDGDRDLVLASNTQRERVLLNDGRGCFVDASSAWMPAVIDVTQDLQLGDLDGDGDLDLVAGNEPGGGGRNRLYLNAGGRFVDASARLPASPQREETRKVALGDIDGDRDLDLVFGNVDFQNPEAAINRVLVNDGGAGFIDESTVRLPPIHRATLDVVLHDLDDDGDRDLVLANFGSGLQVLRNDGSGRFSEATAEVLGALALPRNSIGVLPWEADGRRYLYEAGFNVVDRLLAAELGAPRLDARYSGAFVPEGQDGHGFFLNVLDEALTLAWFTYDADGRPLFLTAAAPRPPAGQASVELQAVIGEGMRFREFNPASLREQAWGTLRLTLVDCDSALLTYDSGLPAADGQPFGRGELRLRRLFRLPGLDCRGGR